MNGDGGGGQTSSKSTESGVFLERVRQNSPGGPSLWNSQQQQRPAGATQRPAIGVTDVGQLVPLGTGRLQAEPGPQTVASRVQFFPSRCPVNATSQSPSIQYQHINEAEMTGRGGGALALKTKSIQKERKHCRLAAEMRSITLCLFTNILP